MRGACFRQASRPLACSRAALRHAHAREPRAGGGRRTSTALAAWTCLLQWRTCSRTCASSSPRAWASASRGTDRGRRSSRGRGRRSLGTAEGLGTSEGHGPSHRNHRHRAAASACHGTRAGPGRDRHRSRSRRSRSRAAGDLCGPGPCPCHLAVPACHRRTGRGLETGHDLHRHDRRRTLCSSWGWHWSRWASPTPGLDRARDGQTPAQKKWSKCGLTRLVQR